MGLLSTDGVSLAVRIGGFGGAAGDAGSVTVNRGSNEAGLIETRERSVTGLLAQSKDAMEVSMARAEMSSCPLSAL